MRWPRLLTSGIGGSGDGDGGGDGSGGGDGGKGEKWKSE